MIEAISKSVAGLDVHKAIIVCTVLKEESDGQLTKKTREFKTFRNELKKLASWLTGMEVELVVMESTGIYWKHPYETIEDAGLKAYVVNARHIKNVPGRKTDVMDSEWLAELARCGLLRPSFIPPRDFRELRLLTRYRSKLNGVLSAEKNRLQKLLEAEGIKLSCVVSDIDGVSAARMIEAILERKKPKQIVELALGRLKNKKKELLEALEDYHLSDRSQFLLRGVISHIKWIKHIRRVLCEIANAAVKTNSQFKGLYQGLVIRRGRKRAIVAIGHKILKIAYIMLKNKEPYKDPEIDYEAMLVKKNAPRWIKALKKYGYFAEAKG